MFNSVFLKDAAERAVLTFLQAFAGAVVVFGLNDYKAAAGVGVAAGILAVLKALAAYNVGTKGNASLSV